VLRLWALGELPQGVHGDEAQVGLDARRVLADGWIGPYTPSALGQPSGHAYLTAPSVWLLGSTPFAVRLPLALVAIAAIPLAYLLFRLQSNRVVATLAAFLLATSLWHIHFSRVAHWPSSYVTVALAVLVLWTLAMRTGRWYWFVAAGGVLGLGLYTYNVYPVFVLAFGLWVAVYTLVFKRDELRVWGRHVALAAVVALVVGLPLFVYIADPANDYFKHYRQYYDEYSVLQSPAYEAAGFWGKTEIVAEQAKRFVGAYVWQGIADLVDASSPDGRPMLDKLTVALFAVGAVYAVRHWRETPHLLSLMLIALIPLTTVLQTNATYRAPLGVVPFLSFVAAAPLTLAWQAAPRFREIYRPLVYGGVALLLAVIAFVNVRAYFDYWADSLLFPWVYAQQISEASEYVAGLPDQPYVYFLSHRWSFNYETRQYLAPGAAGEDRSQEFGLRQDLAIDRSRPSLILLLPPYTAYIDHVRAFYPDGYSYSWMQGSEPLFIAYHVPAVTAPPAGMSPR
jgi:4-amino-4-deoxy-L-arabinose transferase-like glycosyltransferase